MDLSIGIVVRSFSFAFSRQPGRRLRAHLGKFRGELARLVRLHRRQHWRRLRLLHSVHHLQRTGMSRSLKIVAASRGFIIS